MDCILGKDASFHYFPSKMITIFTKKQQQNGDKADIQQGNLLLTVNQTGHNFEQMSKSYLSLTY